MAESAEKELADLKRINADLLSACRQALDHAMLSEHEYCRQYDGGNYLIRLEAALAKAEGK